MAGKIAVLAFLIGIALIGVATAGPPAEGVSWDNYRPDGVHHPAKAELRTSNGITTMAATIPVSGTRPLLVILVAASDVAPTAAHTQAFFETAFFGTRPSVVDYYTETSYGDFTYTQADTLGWYTSSYTVAQIANANTYDAVRWGIQQADATFNYAPYDTNGDGTVTNEELTIYVITTGTGGDWGGTAVWAHHWWAGSVTCDGKTIEGEYSITSEMNPIGTFCHELGHDLGLPDLYDTDDTNGDSNGIGHFGLMGSGSWCGPTQMTAWEKAQVGWLTPTVVPANGFYNILAAETNREAYILRNAAHGTDEYFMVENRWRGTSYDSISGPEGRLNDEGIAIYHIDEARAASWWSAGTNSVNADETHKGVDVECADMPTSHVANADHLDALTNRGDANDFWDNAEYDFTDTSTPCAATWYGGGASGMGVEQIPVPGTTMRTYLRIAPNQPPTAVPGGPYTGNEGAPIVFDGSGSFDPDPGDSITRYEWDLDNNGVYDVEGVSPSNSWCDNGVYTVTLRVTDSFGATGTATTTVTVNNVAPVANAGPDQTVNEGDTVTFTGSAIDPGWCDTLAYEWDLDGDGNYEALSKTILFNWCDNGVHTLTLRVTDDDGGIGTDSVTVTVNNVAPVANAGPDQTVDEGAVVTFTGSATDPGCDTFTYEWDFDGNGVYDATGQTVTHSWCDDGVHTVTLRVTDDDGGIGTDTLTVTVNNVAPAVAPIVLVQPNPQFILPKVHRLTFQGTFADPGCDTWTYEWTFGDGTPAVTGSLAAIAPLSTRHIFAVPGDYTVTLTVRDDDGGQDTETFLVHVTDEYGALHDLKAYVQDLPSGAFSGNAASLKAMLSSQFNALEVKLQHKDYPGFIRDITSIRAKADGEKIGRVRDDWIIDKTAQQHVCMKIDDLVAYIKTRM